MVNFWSEELYTKKIYIIMDYVKTEYSYSFHKHIQRVHYVPGTFLDGR